MVIDAKKYKDESNLPLFQTDFLPFNILVNKSVCANKKLNPRF